MIVDQSENIEPSTNIIGLRLVMLC